MNELTNTHILLIVLGVGAYTYFRTRDNAFFEGEVKRTRPKLWERAKKLAIKKYGDSPDAWDARIAQQAVRIYKQQGGGYIGKKDPKNSLSKWTKENWEYCGGKEGRYLPRKVCEALTPRQRKITAQNKIKGGGEGSRVPWEPFVLKAFKKVGIKP